MWHFFCTFYFSNHSNWKHTTLDQKEYAGGLGSASELTVEYVDKEILNLNVLENHKEILNRKASEYVSNYCRRNDNKCSDAHIVNLNHRVLGNKLSKLNLGLKVFPRQTLQWVHSCQLFTLGYQPALPLVDTSTTALIFFLLYLSIFVFVRICVCICQYLYLSEFVFVFVRNHPAAVGGHLNNPLTALCHLHKHDFV